MGNLQLLLGLAVVMVVTVGLVMWGLSALNDDGDGLATSADEAGLGESLSSAQACDAAVEEAVNLSAEQSTSIQLLKVRGVRVLEDNRETYTVPTGTREATVVECKGTGVWSDGDSTTKVLIRVTVDADSEFFVYYEAV